MSNLSKLFDLINQANGTSVAPTDFSLSGLKPWTAEGDFRNTEITVTGRLEKGYTGSKVFYYRRPDLGLLFKDVDVAVVVPHTGASTVDVLASLNGQFPQLGLTVDDVDLLSITDDALETTITATEMNLYWSGTCTVRVVRELTDISTLFTVHTLDGFNYVT